MNTKTILIIAAVLGAGYLLKTQKGIDLTTAAGWSHLGALVGLPGSSSGVTPATGAKAPCSGCAGGAAPSSTAAPEPITVGGA